MRWAGLSQRLRKRHAQFAFFVLWRGPRMHYTHRRHLVLRWLQALTDWRDGQNDLALVCFYTLTPWWEGHLPDGTAGAEEAMVSVARALSDLGWNVTVYNNCGGVRRMIGRVRYVPLPLYNPYHSCAVTILWRSAEPLSHRRRSRKTYLWLHNVAGPDELPPRYLHRLEKILVLSQFHKSTLPNIADDKVLVSCNGIERPASASSKPPVARRHVRQCIYASAPSRGLECLLRMWPYIRERVPDATLRVHYGWADLDWCDQDLPAPLRQRARLTELLEQPGILAKNVRLSLDELWNAFSACGVWVYPTEVAETSCITAMRAQAAGAIPVVTTVGALPETVRWGSRIEAGNIYTNQDAQRAFADAVVHHLQQPGEEMRMSMQRWAEQRWDWNTVAKEWTEEFRGACINVRPAIDARQQQG